MFKYVNANDVLEIALYATNIYVINGILVSWSKFNERPVMENYFYGTKYYLRIIR